MSDAAAAVSGYQETKERVERLSRRGWRLVALVAIAALVLVSGVLVVVTGDLNGVNGTVKAIRQQQMKNTAISSHRSNCDITAQRDFIYDLVYTVTLPAGTTRAQFAAGLKIPSGKC